MTFALIFGAFLAGDGRFSIAAGTQHVAVAREQLLVGKWASRAGEARQRSVFPSPRPSRPRRRCLLALYRRAALVAQFPRSSRRSWTADPPSPNRHCRTPGPPRARAFHPASPALASALAPSRSRTPRPVASRRPQRSTHLHRLAGDDGGDRVAVVHGVGIHDPRPSTRSRWCSRLGPARRSRAPRVFDDARRVAPRQTLQLAHRHRRRIAHQPPPLAPPNGMLTSAHFHVIHAASAFHFLERHPEVESGCRPWPAPRDRVVEARG